MIKFRNFAKISSYIFHIICQNLIRQFLNVTFNEIFCKLALFLFYGTPAEYIASGNSWWLLWPKCWLETEFDCRFRLRFSQLNQLNQTNCALSYETNDDSKMFGRVNISTIWYISDIYTKPEDIRGSTREGGGSSRSNLLFSNPILSRYT